MGSEAYQNATLDSTVELLANDRQTRHLCGSSDVGPDGIGGLRDQLGGQSQPSQGERFERQTVSVAVTIRFTPGFDHDFVVMEEDGECRVHCGK